MPPAATAAATGPNEGKGGGGQEAAFPWRPTPRDRRSWWQALMAALQEAMPQAYLQGLFYSALGNVMETPQKDVEDLLLRCSRFAFIQVGFRFGVGGLIDGYVTTASAAPSIFSSVTENL